MVRRCLLLCLLVVSFGLFASPASGAEKTIWGPTKLPGGGSSFPLYRDLGVDTWQVTLDWSSVAPNRPARPQDPSDPAYRWPAGLDAAVSEAGANGVNVALLTIFSPRWANGGRSRLWVPDTGAYADFLTAAKRRYPSIRRWMIWGEPNLGSRFLPSRKNDSTAPRAYARLLDAAYVALKRASRRNIVIGGMTTTAGDIQPADFLRAMRLPNGRRPRLDWFGHNPFPFRFPNIRSRAIPGGFRDVSDLDLFSHEIARAYTRPCGRRGRRCGRAPRVWVSEFTVQSDHPSTLFKLSVGRAAQARWLTAAFRLADRLPSVAGMGWHTLLDNPVGPRSPTMGLMTAAGKRKPAFRAFRDAPSRRFRPSVRAPRRVRRSVLGGRGLVVKVSPKARGRLVIRLASRRGRTLSRVARRVREGRSYAFRLRHTLRRTGKMRIEVAAPRGELVVRVLQTSPR